jgi:hypothetical protein
MSMSPLLFRRSLHGRAGPGSFFDLSQLVVARSDRRGRALARFRGEGCEGRAIQNDSGLPQRRADHSVLG